VNDGYEVGQLTGQLSPVPAGSTPTLHSHSKLAGPLEGILVGLQPDVTSYGYDRSAIRPPSPLRPQQGERDSDDHLRLRRRPTTLPR